MFTVRNLRGNPLGFGPYNFSANESKDIPVIDKHIEAARVRGDVEVTNVGGFTNLAGNGLNDTAIAAHADANGLLVDPGATYTRAELRQNFATLAAHNKKLEDLVVSLIKHIEKKNL